MASNERIVKNPVTTMEVEAEMRGPANDTQ